ncbi:hypothetical protein SAMN05216167_13139 [Spirosoma endophyticum]|uniref:Uncharacterized protein n=2 Tax=Spirosoma endophyticum TaxID=662367 RepID=A0A1I2GDZ0_9BACT|nr:hypothetical protein SAMN05216167_13139 [Spirosoma endophyticum]
MIEQVTQLDLPNIETITVNNNEFGIKYRLFYEQPDTSFLLYFPYGQPVYEQNWLLDVQLAGYVFRTDLQAQFMQDLNLDYHYHTFVSTHIEFFKSNRRREKLAKLGIPTGESEAGLRNRMLAVVFGQESLSLSEMLLAYAHTITTSSDDRFG